MANWREDKAILALKERFEREGVSQGLIDALRAAAPGAMQRAGLREEYGPTHAAFIGAGSELMRLKEGGQMLLGDLLDDKEMRENAERDRELRERTMAPLEEARPVSTFVGEMGPGMALPGGLAGGLAKRVATSALTGGVYEGIGSGGDLGDTALAAAVAPVFSEAGRGLGRYLLGNPRPDVPGPNQVGAGHKKMLAEASNLGVKMTPAQRTGNPVLEQYEASMARSPYMSAPFFELVEGNQRLANRTAREAIGLRGDDIITDDVLNARHADLGDEFEKLVGGNEIIKISPAFANDIAGVQREYMRGITRDPESARILENIKTLANDPFLSVREYQQIASDLAAKARDLKSSDAPASRAMYAARAVLDREFDTVFGKLPDLQKNRALWRRLRQIEESGALLKGNFRAATFARYLKSKRVGQGRIQGSEPIDRLSALAQYLATSVPNSGTPTGQAIPDFMSAPLWQKGIMGMGNQISGNYLRRPGTIAGPGAMGYLPPAMREPIPMLRPDLSRQLVVPIESNPVEALTGLLGRGGRGLGVEGAQQEGPLGGLF